MEDFFKSIGENPLTTPQNGLERVFDSLGLMRGPNAPYYRVAFGFAVVSAILFLAKPSIFFNEYGAPRDWAATDTSPDATMVPWWMVAALAGLALGVFV